jgi:hypothetical protein
MSVNNVSGVAGGYKVGSGGMTVALKRQPQEIHDWDYILFDHVECGRGLRYNEEIGMFEATEDGTFFVQLVIGVASSGPVYTELDGAEYLLSETYEGLFVGTRSEALHLKQGESFFIKVIAEKGATVSGNEQFTRVHACHVCS